MSQPLFIELKKRQVENTMLALHVARDMADLMDRWYAFSRDCATSQYTDTSSVWELMEPYLDKYRPGHEDPWDLDDPRHPDYEEPEPEPQYEIRITLSPYAMPTGQTHRELEVVGRTYSRNTRGYTTSLTRFELEAAANENNRYTDRYSYMQPGGRPTSHQWVAKSEEAK